MAVGILDRVFFVYVVEECMARVHIRVLESIRSEMSMKVTDSNAAFRASEEAKLRMILDG